MDNRLYSELSEVCHAFYRLYFPHQKIADLIDRDLKKYDCKKIVFFGGLVHAAKILQERGYGLTFADYTEGMAREARKVLGTGCLISDMRHLKLEEKQDAIVLMGRIFTYMRTDRDALKALRAFRKNLKRGGIVIMDNYETGKIEKGKYFNGIVKAGALRRTSKMRRTRKSPALYSWDCVYEAGGKRYEDKNHILRAFTKEEIQKLVEKAGLAFVGNKANFERRSFVTIAKK